MIYEFADFEVDSERHVLRRAGSIVRLEAKPFAVLTYLVENRGRVVTKRELTEVVWRGAAVSRSTLPIAVHAARRAIGQEQRGGGPILTVGRDGYRFGADVSVAEAAAGPQSVVASPFVGRSEVMDRLATRLDEARAGRGRIVVLAGEAGVGKSRVAHELTRLAREFGIVASTAHCTEGGGAPALWPWRQVIATNLETMSPRQLALLLDGGLPPEVDRLFPVLGRSVPVQRPVPAVGGAAAHHRVYDTLVRLLLGPASMRPRLIVLEDLQWADPASLELMAHLALRIADARLLVVGTLREPDIAAGDAKLEQLHRIFRAASCDRVDLAPLSAADVSDLVASLVRRADSSRLAAAVYQKTQGNPLFVEETVRWLLASSGGDATLLEDRLDVPLPDAVRVVIRRRLRALRQPTQHLLTVAAVLGMSFDLSLLAQVTGGETSDPVSCVDEAAAARLLVVSHGGLSCRFSHAHVRDAIYEDLPAARRGAIHLEVAQALEAQAGPDPDRFLDELAFHFHRALPRAPARAFAYGLRAARTAHSVLADEQACVRYERALEAWGFQQEGERDHAKRCLALLGLASCALSGRPAPLTTQVVAEAIRLATAIGRPDLRALGVVLANVYVTAGYPTALAVREATEEALGALPEGFPSVRAYLLSRIPLDARVPLQRRRALVVQTIEQLRSREDGGALDDLLGSEVALVRSEAVRVSLGSLGPDDLRLCVRLATDVIHGSADEDLLSAWMARRIRARAHLSMGDLAASEEDVEACREIAARLRSSLLDFDTIGVDAYRAQREGRFLDARRELDRLTRTDWPIEPAHQALLLRVRSVVLEDERGEPVSQQSLEEYGYLLDRAPAELVRVYHFPRPAADAIACRMALASGRRDLARETFQTVVRAGLDAIPKDDFYLTTLCDLAFVCSVLGDREHAADLHDRLVPYAALVAVEIPLHYRGPVAHFIGMLARTLGREAAAIEAFEAAAVMGERLEAWPMLDRTRTELARLGRP